MFVLIIYFEIIEGQFSMIRWCSFFLIFFPWMCSWVEIRVEFGPLFTIGWGLRRRSKAFCIYLGVPMGKNSHPGFVFILPFPRHILSLQLVCHILVVYRKFAKTVTYFLLYTPLAFPVEWYIIASLEPSYERALSLVENVFVSLELLLCPYRFK